jgi:peroxiredoxin Q/BCP
MNPFKNSKAPYFKLKDESGKIISLSHFKGKWVVIFFYPKDDTPGCTKEACNFRDNYSGIQSLGAHVIGISLDKTTSHQKFKEKYQLPFMLLSDPQGKVAKKYGALFKFMFIKFSKRHSFIIDPQGLIRKEYRSVNPSTHSNQIIADLTTFQDKS